MKKYWRCFVCNDVHFGVKPPGICPTCKVRNAYVETTSDEAQKVMSPAQVRFQKEDFLKAIEKFTLDNEFQVNANQGKVQMLLEGIFSNEALQGLKYCPCRLSTKDFQEDLKIVCPCNFLIHETYKGKDEGECWCGLFVRRRQ